MTTQLGSQRRIAVSPRRSAIGSAIGLAAGALAGVAAGFVAEAGTAAVAVGGVLGVLAVAAGWPDLRDRRIPNRVVLAGLGATVAIAVAVAVGGDRPVSGSVIGGAALAGGLLLVLHLARPSSLGFGDVKLAAVLGALVGVVHWSLAAVMLAGASLAGAAGALAFAGWRRSIPFGTCMAASALLTIGATSPLRDAVGLW